MATEEKKAHQVWEYVRDEDLLVFAAARRWYWLRSDDDRPTKPWPDPRQSARAKRKVDAHFGYLYGYLRLKCPRSMWGSVHAVQEFNAVYGLALHYWSRMRQKLLHIKDERAQGWDWDWMRYDLYCGFHFSFGKYLDRVECHLISEVAPDTPGYHRVEHSPAVLELLRSEGIIGGACP